MIDSWWGVALAVAALFALSWAIDRVPEPWRSWLTNREPSGGRR